MNDGQQVAQQTREEWLASLESGSPVIVAWGRDQYQLTTVERRTPTGRIVLQDEHTSFGKDGREIARPNKWSVKSHLEPVTDEILAILEHRAIVTTVNSLIQYYNINVLKKLGTHELTEIREVLERYTVPRTDLENNPV